MLIIESRPCVAGVEWEKEGELKISLLPLSMIQNEVARLCALICCERVKPQPTRRPYAIYEVRALLHGREVTRFDDRTAREILAPGGLEALKDAVRDAAERLP